MTSPLSRTGKTLFVAGRSGLALLFVLGGILKAVEPSLYLDMMHKAGLAPAVPLLIIVAVLELVAGLAIMLGHRLGSAAALMLAVHTMLINLFIHRFWELEEPIRSLTIGLFSKNVAIAFALLCYAGASMLLNKREALP